MRSRAWTGIVLLASAMTMTMTSVAHAECSKDTDCQGDAVCMNGACVNPTAPGQATPLEPLPPAPPPPAAIPPGPPPPVQALPPPGALPPPPGPDPGAVPVTFGGAEGYVVRTTTRSGQVLQCTSPCTLPLSPGKAEIEIVGQFNDTIEVPNHPARAEISFRKKGLLITGAILSGVGLITVWFGIDLKSAYDDCMAQEGSQRTGNTIVTTDCQAKDNSKVVIVAGALIGAVGLGLLIPGIVSKTAVRMTDGTTARSPWKNLRVGFSPRREGGGYFTAGYAF